MLQMDSAICNEVKARKIAVISATLVTHLLVQVADHRNAVTFST